MFAYGPLISIISGKTPVFLLMESHHAGNNSNMCLESHMIGNNKFFLYTWIINCKNSYTKLGSLSEAG